MVCYLNVYILSRINEDVDIQSKLKELGFEVMNVVKSIVVPNMFFVRIVCGERDVCSNAMEKVREVLKDFSWSKLEIVCP